MDMTAPHVTEQHVTEPVMDLKRFRVLQKGRFLHLLRKIMSESGPWGQPNYGIRSTCPATTVDPRILLARFTSAIDLPYRAAIEPSVSPLRTL
jgi:hypothetical protein